MSSTYVIPNPVTTKDKPIEQWIEYEDCFVIGKTSRFAYGIDALLSYLPDNTPIVCIDNNSRITNLKELKEHYNQ